MDREGRDPNCHADRPSPSAETGQPPPHSVQITPTLNFQNGTDPLQTDARPGQASRGHSGNSVCLLRSTRHELANDVTLHTAHIYHANELAVMRARNYVMWRCENPDHLFL